METQFDIKELIKKGEIKNELEVERALIADRKLRILSKKDPSLKQLRSKLRDLIEKYESKNWSQDLKISNKRILESDVAESIAENERQFIQRRKDIILEKLKKIGLTQQDFGVLLGHKNKSYISELMNGVRPFSLRDIIVINRLLKIDLTKLVPTFLPQDERVKIRSSIKKIDNPNLKLSKEDFELV
ncbi:helix-turn-helix transcriptional regulator [Salegentibacter sp. JZCK2]|uniref:helix-turn-helix domain-containing protein n=1 Tax=Salegentibacter tibetensis TaxID=2873600 RepID=UPI001CCAFA37|nr:helix-turn-helix transcriptional regulator [Salegentibacter tibetensis]MBZ9729726.1 helix-turn-helix transcriptional regulator [Salegentibacter tibetensis]